MAIINYFMQIVNPLGRNIKVLGEDTTKQDINTLNNFKILNNIYLNQQYVFAPYLSNFKLSYTFLCRGGAA